MIQTEDDGQVIKPSDPTQVEESSEELVQEDINKKEVEVIDNVVVTSLEKTEPVGEAKELPKKAVVAAEKYDSEKKVVVEKSVVLETPKQAIPNRDKGVKVESEKLEDKKAATLVVEIKKTPETEKKIVVEKGKEEIDDMEVDEGRKDKERKQKEFLGGKMEVDVEPEEKTERKVSGSSTINTEDLENQSEVKESKKKSLDKRIEENRADKEEETSTTDQKQVRWI